MALAIPANNHAPNDTGPGHISVDHNNLADVLSLLSAVLAQFGGVATTPPAINSGLAGGNAAAITALSAMLSSRAGYYPWQFRPETYGAKGDGKVVNDGTITTGTNLLTCSTSAPFVAGDVGKSILVSCAGGGTYSPLATTISSYVSATQVHLTANATSTTPGNSITGFATDDTSAIQQALNAATAYAQSSQGSYAEVVFGAVIYGVAGAAVIGGTTKGNAQITLPICPPASEKIIIVFTGVTKTIDQSLMHWLQTAPQSSGSVLMCLRADGTNDGTNGPASMIGGPFAGYGGDLGLFTNLMPVIDGLQLLVSCNSTFGGFDFFGCAEAVVLNASCMAMAIVPAAPPYPNITSVANISNQYTFGLRMPCTGNNDRCDVLFFSSEGLCYGAMPSEHAYCSVLRCIYCITGIEFYSGNAVSMPHSAYVAYASVEGGTNACGVFDGTVNLDMAVLDSETCSTLLYDPSNRGQGTIGFRFLTPPAYEATAGSIVNGGAGVKMLSLDNAVFAGVVTSGAPAAPATTVAQLNGWYRDAAVYITSTAAITVVKISNAAGTLTTITGLTTAGAGTVMITVPAGRSYSVTTTGTITTQWVPA